MIYSGIVIHGLENGRKFGFPTANILLDNPEIKLEKGIFAVTVELKHKHFHGMLYVGTRPTLKLHQQTIEINIFNFNEIIYDDTIRFEIIKKMRDEMIFSNINQLISQLNNDRNEIQSFFNHF